MTGGRSYGRAALILALLALAGCGAAGKVVSGPKAAAEKAILPDPLGVDQAGAERLIRSGAPSIAVSMLDRGDGVLMVRAGERAGVTRWRSIDNVQLYTRGGLLVGTRGLGGDDLMTADPGGVLALALAGQGGQVTRVETRLDGDRRTELRRFTCTLTPDGTDNVPVPRGPALTATRLNEVCRPQGKGRAFANSYWIREGRVLQTVQHVSDGVGRVKILYIP